jgi:hypothetical protein
MWLLEKLDKGLCLHPVTVFFRKQRWNMIEILPQNQKIIPQGNKH